MKRLKKASFSRSRSKEWLKLGVGIGLLALVTYVFGPLGLKLPGMGAFSQFVQTRDIQLSAIFYTDSEEFSHAESDLRHRLE